MVANWATPSVALPSLSKDGSICKWYTEASGGTEMGASEATWTSSSITGTSVTAFARCVQDNIEITNVSATATTHSITLVTTAHADSGIQYYEYSIDGGENWERDTSNIYTFDGLDNNTTYSIIVKAVSNTNLEDTYDVDSILTGDIETPSFSEVTSTTGKNVTITYDGGCIDGTFACYYELSDIDAQQGDGEESTHVPVTPSSENASVVDGKLVITLPFTEDKVITAFTTDEVNIVSSTYTVVMDDNLYVSSSGSDTTGTGSVANPYKTIAKAYSEASSIKESTIYIMNNITQTGTVEMNQNKDIILTSSNSSGVSGDSIINSVIRGSSFKNQLINPNSGTLTLENITLDGNNVSAEAFAIGGTATEETRLILDSGTTIKNNVSTYANGGGVALGGPITLEINGATITNNKAPLGGGIHYGEETTIIMNSGTISNNTATSSGGGINGSGDLIMNAGTISLNKATNGDGGGIRRTGGSTTINGGAITSNTASGIGGGIGLATGPLIIRGETSITSNTAGNGGGVYVATPGDITFESGSISNNTATGGGGGLVVSGTGELSGGTISSNTSSSNGGGVAFGGTITLSGTNITGNTAVNRGGGIWGASTSTLNFSSGQVSSNTVTTGNGYGAGIFSDGTVSMSGGEITDNTARTYAGGLFCNGTCSMSGGSITGNTATANEGGGIRVNGTFSISGGTINDNTASVVRTKDIGLRTDVSGPTIYDEPADFISNNSIYYIAYGINDTFVMDLTSGAAHGNIQLYTNALSANHKWKLFPGKVIDGTVYYNIESQKNTTQYMSVEGNSSEPGANVFTWEFGNSNGRFFSLDNLGDGLYNIKNITGTCMDKAGGADSPANSQNIQTYTCNQSDAQKWKFVGSSSVPKYTINFNANGGTGTTASKICDRDSNCTLTANGFTRTNYKFLGWATSASGAKVYNDKATVNNLAAAGGSITLYAVWRDNTKLYVSSSGNDSTGFGTIAAPYATVPKAFSEAASSATIYLMSSITQSATTTMGSKTITLTSCTKSSNTACAYSTNYALKRGSANTGYIINHTGGTLNLTNIDIDGNNVNTTTRMVSNTGTLNINSGTKMYKAYAGGALSAGGTTTMNSGQIYSNTDNTGGGGVNVPSGATFYLKGGAIHHNSQSGASGGGIYVSGKLVMSAGTISNNVSGTYGGGIMCQGNCSISGGTISDNHSPGGHGGGIWIGGNATAFSFSGGTVRGNRTSSYGGGIGGVVKNITGGTISGNSANRGGGVYCNDSCKISGVTIQSNTASSIGGGIYITSDAKVTFSGKTIKNNSAASSGGGVYKTSGGTYTKSGSPSCSGNGQSGLSSSCAWTSNS